MKSALIGYTGFVGSNIGSQLPFSDLFRSSNIQDIDGKEFDLVVSAGFSAVKWQANKDPEKDWAGIKSLLLHLGKVRAKRFVLISTVDVYGKTGGADEDTEPDSEEAYGRNRLRAEKEIRSLFGNALIVRLPALFGKGLKKNVLFDLLNDNQPEKINRADAFQYYDLSRIGKDIETCLGHGLATANFVTEPVGTEEIIRRFFPSKEGAVPPAPGPGKKYDVHTKHAPLFGRKEPYLYGKEEVWERMEAFIDAYVPEPA